MRAGRGARVGTRAGRIVRIVRILRLVRVMKLYKHSKAMAASEEGLKINQIAPEPVLSSLPSKISALKNESKKSYDSSSEIP